MKSESRPKQPNWQADFHKKKNKKKKTFVPLAQGYYI